MVRFVCALILGIVLYSCSLGATPTPAIRPADVQIAFTHTLADKPDASVADLKDQRRKNDAEILALRSANDVLDQEIVTKTDEDNASDVRWFAAIVALIGVALGVAAFIGPIGLKTALGEAAALAVGLSLVAVFAAQYVHYWKFGGAALVLALVAWLLSKVHIHGKTLSDEIFSGRVAVAGVLRSPAAQNIINKIYDESMKIKQAI